MDEFRRLAVRPRMNGVVRSPPWGCSNEWVSAGTLTRDAPSDGRRAGHPVRHRHTNLLPQPKAVDGRDRPLSNWNLRATDRVYSAGVTQPRLSLVLTSSVRSVPIDVECSPASEPSRVIRAAPAANAATGRHSLALSVVGGKFLVPQSLGAPLHHVAIAGSPPGPSDFPAVVCRDGTAAGPGGPRIDTSL